MSSDLALVCTSCLHFRLNSYIAYFSACASVWSCLLSPQVEQLGHKLLLVLDAATCRPRIRLLNHYTGPLPHIVISVMVGTLSDCSYCVWHAKVFSYATMYESIKWRHLKCTNPIYGAMCSFGYCWLLHRYNICWSWPSGSANLQPVSLTIHFSDTPNGRSTPNLVLCLCPGEATGDDLSPWDLTPTGRPRRGSSYSFGEWTSRWNVSPFLYNSQLLLHGSHALFTLPQALAPEVLLSKHL